MNINESKHGSHIHIKFNNALKTVLNNYDGQQTNNDTTEF